MSTKKKPNTITTLNQICNIVNDDNIELLINDFAQWLTWYNSAIKAAREKIPKDTENLKNIQIAKSDFIWTDDGKKSKVDFTNANELNKGFYCKNETFVKNYHGEYCKTQCDECSLKNH